MSVTLRRMTIPEFEAFGQWSIEHHARELMEQSHMTREQALQETVAEVDEMLPNGLNTEHNHLMSIVADSGEIAGFIWTIHEDAEDGRQCFVCDFAVWEPHRRKGYGEAALALAEQNAAADGCRKMALFVADYNTAASALYRKSGYQFLRPESYGRYMIKQLP